MIPPIAVDNVALDTFWPRQRGVGRHPEATVQQGADARHRGGASLRASGRGRNGGRAGTRLAIDPKVEVLVRLQFPQLTLHL